MQSIIHYNQRKPFTFFYLGMFLLMVSFSSCQKFLDKKPDKRKVVPSTLSDLQALLDNQQNLNTSPSWLLELSADNYFVYDNDYNVANVGALISEAHHYTWNAQALPSDNWVLGYINPVYTCNVVLDQLAKLTTAKEESMATYLRGAALFGRAFAFERLAQLYCKPYHSSTAANDLGLVLRTTSAIEAPTARATVKETYDRILTDLKEAALLLPATAAFPTKPTKTAAYGELARTYLSIRQYDSAGHYANLALGLYNTLIDYNTRVPVGSPPMATFNPEVIFQSAESEPFIMGFSRIDSILTQSYHDDDLRKLVFFRLRETTITGMGIYSFRGGYNGNVNARGVFHGISTGELYLIRAECYAKAGKTAEAMADLNTLMQKRWKSATWNPFSASTPTQALQIIRMERRKELVFRGQRWSDLRRYNLEDSSITLRRVVNGTTYTLPPNDNRWVMLIPDDVINRSGIQQNPR